MSDAESTDVGFIGLGRMGLPMARRLAQAGCRVRGYDVCESARRGAEAVPGVDVVASLADVAAATVVVLMLPDSDRVEEVLLEDGLLRRLTPSTVLVDMGSSEPTRTRELAATAGRLGVTLVDAPVSGGVAGAENGTLTIMYGGPGDVLDRLRPIFSALGANLVAAGSSAGAGHAVKALNNLMSAGHLLLSSEAILAGRAFGIEPDVMLEIVNSSSGRSGSTQTKWPSFVLPGTYDSGFGLRLMLKDMHAAVALERQLGTPGPLSEAAVRAWERAAADLADDADHTEIVKWLETQPDQGVGP